MGSMVIFLLKGNAGSISSTVVTCLASSSEAPLSLEGFGFAIFRGLGGQTSGSARQK